MLGAWNELIFAGLRARLQDAAMALVEAERRGEASFDPQLVVGVRQSYGIGALG